MIDDKWPMEDRGLWIAPVVHLVFTLYLFLTWIF